MEGGAELRFNCHLCGCADALVFSNFMKLLSFTALLLSLFVVTGHARTWTSEDGKTIEADYVRLDGANAILKMKGKEIPVPLSRLSVGDRAFIEQADLAAKNEAATKREAAMKLDGHALIEGKELHLEPALTAPGLKKEIDESNGKPCDTIKMVFVTPVGFDPLAANNKVLIVHATTSGKALSIPVSKGFQKTALEKGWAVMAVDGPHGFAAVLDSTSYRECLTRAGLLVMHGSWPQSAGWTYALAGHSGGAGYASFISLSLLTSKCNVAGMFLSGGGYTPVQWEQGISKFRNEFRKIPVYLSFGKTDQTCTVKIAESTIAKLEAGRYKNSKVAWHDGGHVLETAHLADFLDWTLTAGNKDSGLSQKP